MRSAKLASVDPACPAGCLENGARLLAESWIIEPNPCPRCPVPFRPRKKKSRQSKFHRCSWCGAQVRRRAARCKRCAELQKKK